MKVEILKALAQGLNRATTLGDSLKIALDAICTTMNWSVGHVYLVDQEKQILTPSNIWYTRKSEIYKLFQELTLRTSFTRGIGLPGQVWQANKAITIPSLREDGNFPRLAEATKSGLASGYGVPVTVGNELAAVLEFFFEKEYLPDQTAILGLEYAAQQLGFIIDRKQWERRLIESQEAFQRQNAALHTVISNMSDAVVVSDHQGNLILFNPAAEQLLGYGSTLNSPQIEPQEKFGIFYPETLDEIPPSEQPIVQAVAGKVVKEFEIFVRNENHRKGAYLSVNASPFRQKDGALTGAVAVFRDMSRIRNILKEMDFRKTLLECQIEAAPAGVLIIDPNGKTISSNQSFSNLWEINRNQVDKRASTEIFRTLRERLDENSRTAFDQFIFGAEKRIPQDFGHIQLKNGRFLDCHVAPIKSSEGTWYGTLWIFRDVTSWVEAEFQLLKEKSFIQLLQAVSVASNEAKTVEQALQICLNNICKSNGWDVGHAYIQWDENPETMISSKTWYARDSNRFEQFKQVSEATWFKAGVGVIGKVIKTKTHSVIPDLGADPDFVRVKVAASCGLKACYAFPVFDENKISVVLEFFSSKYEPLKPEILDLMKYVGVQLGFVRARQRTERELVFAREKAIEASRVKSLFLANMSHEIRTPMNAILGISDVLYGTELNPKQREYVSVIIQSGDALSAVINDVLDFSKIESGKLGLYNDEFSFRDTVQNTVQILSYGALRKGLRLDLKIPPHLPQTLRGDMVRIRQILMNLIGNAIKFTESGSVTVQVSVAEDSPGKVKVKTEVVDTGIGIQESAMGRIFEPFSQADPSMTRKYGGTGLGLPISRKLVEMMGGVLGVSSELGRGSRFWFILPLEVVPMESKSAKITEVIPVHLKKTKSEVKILIAEDNAFNRLAILESLAKLGYQADWVESGRGAIEMANARSYDLILMDCQMPGMDGYEATREIRKSESPELREIPIIAVTAHALKGDREKCTAAGMNDYLPKPIELATLEQIISKWIKTTNKEKIEIAKSSQLDSTEESNPEIRVNEESQSESLNQKNDNEGDAFNSGALDKLARSVSEKNAHETIIELVQMFLKGAPKLIEQVKVGIESKDRDLAARAGHDLKSTSLSLGARKFSGMAKKIENFAEKGKFEELSVIYALLIKEFEILKQRLDLECEKFRLKRKKKNKIAA
ncbi:MAG: ATP-binding protein [Bdellovibrionota bacterium]